MKKMNSNKVAKFLGILICGVVVTSQVFAATIPTRRMVADQFYVEISYGQDQKISVMPIELPYLRRGQQTAARAFDAIPLFEGEIEGGRRVHLEARSDHEHLVLDLDASFVLAGDVAGRESCEFTQVLGSPDELETTSFVCGDPSLTGFKVKIVNLSHLDRELERSRQGVAVPRNEGAEQQGQSENLIKEGDTLLDGRSEAPAAQRTNTVGQSAR